MPMEEKLRCFFMRPRNVYDIALYTYLLSLGDGEHRLCTKDTALLLGMSKKTLLEARRRLEMEGLIEVEKGQGQMGAMYRVRSVEECEEDWRRRREEMRGGSVEGGGGMGGHGMSEKPDGAVKVDGAVKADGGSALLNSGITEEQWRRAEEEWVKNDGAVGEAAVQEARKQKERAQEKKMEWKDVEERSVEVNDGLVDSVMREEQQWIETLCVKNRLTKEQTEAMLREFVDTLQCDAVERKEMRDFKHHFSRWLRIEIQKRNNNNNAYNTYGQQRRQEGGQGKQWRGQTKQEQREEQVRRRKADDIARLQRLAARYGYSEKPGGGGAEGGLRQSGDVHAGLESEGATYPFK